MVTQKHPKDHKSRALCSVLCIFCVCTPKTVDFLDKNSQMLFFLRAVCNLDGATQLWELKVPIPVLDPCYHGKNLNFNLIRVKS